MADMTKYDSKLVAVGRIALEVKYDDTAATVRLPALQVLAEVVERLSSWLNRAGKAEEAVNGAFIALIRDVVSRGSQRSAVFTRLVAQHVKLGRYYVSVWQVVEAALQRRPQPGIQLIFA